MKLYFGLSLIIVFLGLSMVVPFGLGRSFGLMHDIEGAEVDLGKLVFKPNPGLFAEISDKAEGQNHSEEPASDIDAGQSLVAKEENVNPPKNKLQPRE